MRRLALVALLCGCQSSPSPKAPGAVEVTDVGKRPPAPVTPAPPVDEALTLAAVPIPPDVAVDGDLREWRRYVTSGRAVLVAPGPDRLVLVTVLPEPGRVSLLLTTPIPSVPDIGWISRGGWTYPMTDETCARQQIPGPEGSWDTGEPNPPEVVRACTDIVARHAAFTRKYYERFVRRFELSAEGVTMDGQPVAGARHVSKAGIVEVELPRSAFPRLAQAPLATLLARASLGALADDVPLPILEYEGHPDPRWSVLALDEPVRFEPWAAEREIAFDGFTGLGSAQEGAMSYHPSEPDVVESLSTPSSSVGLTTKPYSPERQAVLQSTTKLFEPIEALGAIEVGLVLGYMVVTKKGGVIVQSYGFGHLDGIERRDGQLHLFRYSEGGMSPFVGTYMPAGWNVLAVRDDGTFDEDLADPGFDFPGDWNAWDEEPERFANAHLTEFGMRGRKDKRPRTVTWRWDAAKKRYEAREVPATPHP